MKRLYSRCFLEKLSIHLRKSMILIVDFGSQYNQLIARRVRECNVYSQIVPNDVGLDSIIDLKPEGIILSGGPASIYEKESPTIDKAILELLAQHRRHD